MKAQVDFLEKLAEGTPDDYDLTRKINNCVVMRGCNQLVPITCKILVLNPAYLIKYIINLIDKA